MGSVGCRLVRKIFAWEKDNLVRRMRAILYAFGSHTKHQKSQELMALETPDIKECTGHQVRESCSNRSQTREMSLFSFSSLFLISFLGSVRWK